MRFDTARQAAAPSAAPPTTTGTCFGFEVRSTLPFRYLRGGRGEPLDVTAPSAPGTVESDRLVLEWTPPRYPFRAELYTDGGTFRLWVDGSGWFAIDPQARSVALPETADIVRREERLWGIPALLCFAHRGDVPLHAAAVEIDNRGVLIAAPGRFGKTTLSAAFAATGHRVLAEDLSCIRIGERTSVIPGPAVLRLRSDTAANVTLPTGHASVGDDDRVHVALDPALRGDCSPVPLVAVVLLRESTDGIRLERVTASAAIADLWALSFRLPTDEGRARTFTGIADVASTIEVWNLSRPVRFDVLSATVAAITDLARGMGT